MNLQVSPEMRDFIRRIPKTETHLHIEGALPFHLLQGLDAKRFPAPPASWEASFRFAHFKQFEDELLNMALTWYNSPERYHLAAKEIFSQHQADGVVYVETSFHAGVTEFLGIPADEILAAIIEAIPAGLEVRVFLGMLRERSEVLLPMLEEAITWKNLAGIDLHGVETIELQDWTIALWKGAQEEGKVTKAHAGEFGGAKAVRDVLEKLNVKRVQHGVQADGCEETIQLLLEKGATLDVCPISNVKLAVVENMREHPIRRLMQAGVPCTISTDDPISFGNLINDEYIALHNELDFTKEELLALAQNGIAIADVSAEKKAAWLASLPA